MENEVEEEDIENLIIQQIEFCNVIILNKVDEISKEELEQVKTVIRKLQPKAEIIETNYGKVDVSKILDTRSFNLEEVASSAGWIQEMEAEEFEDEHDNELEHEKGHHHTHNHEHGETEEYGISSFVYYRREPFDRIKFENFAVNFPKNVIRCKGLMWFSNEPSIGYVFEQAGKQVQAFESGEWIASAPKYEQAQILRENPDIEKDWDEKYGDRMIKLVFIGKDMNKKEIIDNLDKCLIK